jgi:single-strand DNA-binding protein
MNDPIATLLRASVHQFIGRLGRDPEIRYLPQGGAVANVNIGINWLSDKTQSDWVKLEVWGESGQAFADQARKGMLVSVAGRVRTDRWTDRQTGAERQQLCCRVEQWRILQQPAPAAAPESQQQPASPPSGLQTSSVNPPF